MRRLVLAFASSAVVACGGSAPPSPPIVNPPSGVETITGTERLGWDQPAADAVELAAIRYAIYIDGARTELTGVSCAPSSAAARFSCAAPLPALASGGHALQIASFVVDGSLLESARSAALMVNVARVAPTSGGETVSSGAPASRASSLPAGMEMIAGGFAMVADIAIAPDGRVIVAERSGRIHILGDGRMRDDPATSLQLMLNGGRLLALALDPRFARTHFVYVLYTELAEESHASRDKAAAPLVETFTLARLRESGGTLGDALVVLDGVRASPHPASALRFGPDGKLFAAFDTGPDGRLAGDAASLNGKIVRLNADGTTPADQAGATPAIANGLVGPVGLAWQPSSGTLWSADRRDRTSQLRAVTEGPPTVYALPDDVSPTTIAFARAVDGPDAHDELLIGSEGRTSLLKVSIDRRTARPVKTERLLEDSESGAPVADRSPNTVRALAVGPDGTIYVATPTAVGRIKEWGPSVR